MYFASTFAKLRLAARLHADPLDYLRAAFPRHPRLAGLNGREREGKRMEKEGVGRMAWKREEGRKQMRNPAYFIASSTSF